MEESYPPDAEEPIAPSSLPAQETKRWNGVRLAKFSLWIPFVGFLAGVLLLKLAEEANLASSLGATIGIGGWIIFFGSGLASGIAALRRMRSEGRKGIFGRAIVGLSLNGLLLCGTFVMAGVVIHTASFVAKVEKKEAQDEKELKAILATYDRVSLEFMANIKQQAERYKESGKALLNPPVLDMSAVKSREDLIDRQEKVREFIACSKAMQILETNSPSLYREYLKKNNLPRHQVEARVNSFTTNLLQVHLIPGRRETEQQEAEIMLRVLTLLHDSWGEWEYVPALHRVSFKSTAKRVEYNALAKELDQAQQKLSDLERQAKASEIEK